MKRKLRAFNLDSPFRFGKHTGTAMRDVIKKDLQYVIWVRDNLNATYGTAVKEAIKEAEEV